MYNAEVSADIVDQLVETLGIPRGTFSFNYLGVPLTRRKISYTDYKPLIEKIVTRVKG